MKYFIACLTLLFSFSSIAENLETPLQPPSFSHASGFHKKEFQLTLSHPEPGVTIYYTLDGSEPDPNNLDGQQYRYKTHYDQPPAQPHGEFEYGTYITKKYHSSISILDRTYFPNRLANIATTFDESPDYYPQKIAGENILHYIFSWIKFQIGQAKDLIVQISNGCLFNEAMSCLVKRDYLAPRWKSDKYLYKGTVVRALAEDEHGRRSKIETHNFFIGSTSDFSLPIVAFTLPEKPLFDHDIGIFVAGTDYDKFLTEGKTHTGARHHIPANWRRRDNDNIMGNIQFFSASDSSAIISQDLEMNIHGNATRFLRNKSIRIYPLKENPLGLDYDIFFDGKATGHARINFRNAGNGGESYFKDAAVHEITKGLAFGTQNYSPFVTFLNGEYNGILNARERRDHYYLESNFGVKKGKVDLIKGGRSVQRGNNEHWSYVEKLIKDIDPQSEDLIERLTPFIDLDSFIDYFVTSIYISRGDWPGNNQAHWRYSGKPKADGPVTQDGRWRWLLYDADDALEKLEENRLEFATLAGGPSWPNPDWSTFILRTLLQNEEFKLRFITRFNDLLNTTFVPDRMISIIRRLEQGIEKEMPRHIDRWNAPRSMKHWRRAVRKMVEFSEKRPAIQKAHLQEFFNLKSLINVELNTNQKQAGTIKVNTITLGISDKELVKPVAASDHAIDMEKYLAFPWRGQYFENLPLRLEAIPRAGYQFSHWQSDAIAKELQKQPVLVLHPEEDFKITAVFAPLAR